MRNKIFIFKWSVYLLTIVFMVMSSASFAYPVTPTGKKLDAFLDSLDVTNKWLPYHQVNWRTGESLSQYRNSALGTHCSTFVAAAAAKLGVYILRPPDHDGLLANAQYHWLRTRGIKHGWAAVENNINAQRIANQGCLVVIAYANPNQRKPGHIAIVRPSAKPREEIIVRGPQIIQAGKNNYNSAALTSGFRKPQKGLKTHKIVYYAHNTPFCRLIVQKSARGNSKVKTV
jgi:hypothetical protein